MEERIRLTDTQGQRDHTNDAQWCGVWVPRIHHCGQQTGKRFGFDPARCVDIAQDVVMKILYECFRAFDGAENQQGWVRRLAVNACIDHHRSEIHQEQLPEDLDVMDYRRSETGEAFEEFIEQEELAEILKKLPEDLQSVISLLASDYSADEIAQTLGVSLSTAYRRMREARKILAPIYGQPPG